ncbi:DNA topoisomerase 1 [Symmachiella dynata]|uniref:type I DNA topoisomerase n=1 Tax=Symmachiella dynata TaxID=2527995 RepID=UPI00118A8549|nr:type I DNA topoisomerase [Symmachiella dynata]QDT50579.1 DNA topoisomerase 1 [Symmachiella dynata]
MAKKKVKGLVIVESPAKARKISGYLGSDYIVLASMGHVRDLPAGAAEIPAAVKKEPWSTLGVNVDSEFEPLYIIPKEKKKVVKELKDALKNAQELIIATDEDREGESIGWHLVELLKPKVPVKRMVFSEITKSAIQAAIDNPREMDTDLVSAQETRRVLDRLYGYRLSPLLWKKVAPKLSAGRVQSVAVRVLVRRELERIAFHSGTYWDLKATLNTLPEGQFDAQLWTLGGKRIAAGKDFDEATGKLKLDVDVLLLNEKESLELKDRLLKTDWNVSNIEERQQVRKPYPPFTTSTLQQEANRKLNMTARQTMQTAQRLYEAGHITYMRTDSVNLSTEAIDAARNCVDTRYGHEYLSDGPRQFTSKSKNAQEAHEAIRPAGTEMKTAEELGLSGGEGRLYGLIWKRTAATQMAEARLRFQTVTIAADDAEFRATGRHVEFPGFFRAYVEGTDDPEAALDDQESSLPPMKEADKLRCGELEPIGHETKPPARFTEATLVRALEADGIGRPSTYASIIGTIQDRGYVRKQGSQLVPTFTAMAVTKLLEQYFPNLVDYAFTAKMEQTLDDISNGEIESLPYLKEFYGGEEGLDSQVKTNEEKIDPRDICTLDLEGIESKVRVGRYGPYLQKEQEDGENLTASLPAEISPADITNEMAEKLIKQKIEGPTPIGMHPEEGLPIFVLHGPFGYYMQLGEVTEDGPKPKRVSLPKNVEPENVTLPLAMDLLSLPRTVGQHPETDKVVKAGIGRFGPYVLHNKVYASIPKEKDVLTIGLEDAVDLIKNKKVRGAATPLKELGPHPEDGEMVAVFEGRYGPYVKHGKINATLPKETEPDSVTLERALDMIAEKAAKGGGTKKKKKKATKKKAAKKKTTKKKATKKKAAKKKTTKKKATKKKTAS